MDNLHMLTLFRGGPTVWINYEDAESANIRDNDWLEIFNRNGVVTARAVLSHRIPRGSAVMYHAQERTVNVRRSRISGEPAGSHNGVTKLHLKPTQMIGGYAQLSYEFNYYGPIGAQRDTFVVVRKLKLQEGGAAKESGESRKEAR
jgi:nitrate reductase alpha subunit